MQNRYIPLVLGLEYGLLVFLAIVATVLLVLEYPRSGGFCLLLYWIWLVPVMFTGPGEKSPPCNPAISVIICCRCHPMASALTDV